LEFLRAGGGAGGVSAPGGRGPALKKREYFCGDVFRAGILVPRGEKIVGEDEGGWNVGAGDRGVRGGLMGGVGRGAGWC